MTEPLHDEILQQAAEWFAVLQDEKLSPEQQEKWQAWFNADPKHQQAWGQIGQISGAFDKVGSESNRRAANAALANTGPRSYNSLIAVCLVAVTVGLSWLTLSPYSIFTGAYHYRTAIGETEQVRLQDGTQLWLNTDTEVIARYDDKLRQIVLNQGEVLVDTAPDSHQQHRPLVVDTDNGRLTALGTRFSVLHTHEDTELTVFEGAVRIEPAQTNVQTTVAAGHSDSFSQKHIQEAETSASPAREAWIRGMLVAENMPLCQFMAELDRYRAGDILCPAELNQLKLVGTYPLTDTAAILTAVESSLPVTIRQVSPQLWRIEKK